jgi:hypothetical protein
MRRREFIAGGENRRGWDWAGGGSGGFWRRPDMRGRTGRRSLHPPLGRIGASLAPPCVVAARLGIAAGGNALRTAARYGHRVEAMASTPGGLQPGANCQSVAP